MKCFLLELHVILHESRNEDIKETVGNLIILANSSLSSNGVSHPIVMGNYSGCVERDWEKSLAGYNGQADPLEVPLGVGVNSHGVVSRTGTSTSVHTVQNCSLIYSFNRQLLHDARQYALVLE